MTILSTIWPLDDLEKIIIEFIDGAERELEIAVRDWAVPFTDSFTSSCGSLYLH